METSLASTSWARWSAAVADALRAGKPPAETAAALAGHLQATLPGVAAAAVRLAGAVAGRSIDDPAWAALDAAPPAAGACRELNGALAAAADGVTLLVTPGAGGAALAELLPVWAGTLGLHLERQRAEQAAAALEPAAVVGFAADDIIHDFRNVLNTMNLQVAVAKMKATPEVKEAIDQVRRQVHEAAALMLPLEEFRQRRRQGSVTVSLAALAREAMPDGEAVVADPAARPVAVPAVEFVRLVRFLRARLVAAGGRVWVCVRPAAEGEGTALVLEADGIDAPAEALAEPLARGGFLAGDDDLARLAAVSILRLPRATLRAEPRPGGVAVVVELRG
jgi:hypothetical protein